MTTVAPLSIAVDTRDTDLVERLGLPILACSVDILESGLSTRRGDETIRKDQTYSLIEGFLAASDETAAHLSNVRSAWQEIFGHEAPSLLNLCDVPEAQRRERVLEWLVQNMATGRTQQALRNVRLSRDLYELRRTHEDTQASFRKLEGFFYDVVKYDRWRDYVLAPQVGQPELVLESGSFATQRLPCKSVGLSDVVLQLGTPIPHGPGTLKVILKNFDERIILATWSIEARQLQDRELRLSLPVALNADLVSLTLDLEWEGSQSLHLKTAMPHPDPRFQLQVNGNAQTSVLALEGYRYIVGAAAPVPAEAFIPQSFSAPVRTVSAERLAQAINIKSGRSDLEFMSDEARLLVHVVRGELAVGVLKSICVAGLTEVVCAVKTCHERGPQVEYSIAVVPRSKRSSTSSIANFDFEKGHFSGWLRIDPMVDGELRLEIPQGLEECGDLYLITRLPRNATTADFGWSTFSDVTLHYGQEDA